MFALPLERMSLSFSVKPLPEITTSVIIIPELLSTFTSVLREQAVSPRTNTAAR